MFDFAKNSSEFENCSILDEKYKIFCTIGEGRFSKVKLGMEISSEQFYAIKFMKENQVNTQSKIENFMKEIQTLCRIEHENIIEIEYISIEGNYQKKDGRVIKVIYYIMKIEEYGELYNFLQFTPIFSEKLARFYFKQLIVGLEYLHENGIGHRDIKPENLLIDKNFNLKIADFGFVCQFSNHPNNKTSFPSSEPVGSPEYNAPEISNPGKYGFYFADRADLFAAASVLFSMVMRSQPFRNTQSSDPYYSRLCNDANSFWTIFKSTGSPSKDFKDLIEKLLAEDPDKRLTIDQIKQHPWYKGETPSKQCLLDEMKSRGTTISDLRRNDFQSKLNARIRKRGMEANLGKKSVQRVPKSDCIKAKYKLLIQELNDELNKRRIDKKIKQRQENEEKDEGNVAEAEGANALVECMFMNKNNEYSEVESKKLLLEKESNSCLKLNPTSNYKYNEMMDYCGESLPEDKQVSLHLRRRKMSKDDMDLDTERPRRKSHLKKTKDDMNIRNKEALQVKNVPGGNFPHDFDPKLKKDRNE